MSPLTRPAQDLNWLVTNFVERVPSVAHAIVVSSDGLPMAFSQGFPADRVDQLAAVTSGLTSLTQGASRVFEGGPVSQTVVEMQRGVLIVMAISDGSSLAVLAAADCDMGLVAYEMALMVERVGSALTPEVRDFDPRVALDGGSDGLAGYRSIAATASALLAVGGIIVVELGAGQAQAVAALFAAVGLAPRPPRHDLNDIPRALLAAKSAAGA